MKYIVLLLLGSIVASASAQSKLPLIKATSKSVAIKDDGYLDKNAWSLSPTIRPDVYTADRSRKAKWVVFYTDIDSIKVKVVPGTRFDFVVLLNGKDSCFTQIASSVPAEINQAAKNDTIPFTLNAYNAIAVKAIINETDTVVMHLDLSSFDFRLTREGILKKTKLLAAQPDALAGKAAPNFNKLGKVYKLQMGSAVWTDPPISAAALAAHETDGRFGWRVFEGRKIEIDYDRNLLIVSSALPKNMKGYVRSKLEFGRSYPYLKGVFDIDGKQYAGNFAMDTGSELAMILDSGWVARQHFAAGLKLIKTSSISDGRGVKFETRTVMAPAFSLSNFKQTNVPTLILSNKMGPDGIELNFLGNDLLKRFNMILDFKKDEVYLKPNKLWDVKYKG